MSLFPKNLNEFVAQMGIPRGPLSKAYVYDPVNGDDNNTGTDWLHPLETLEEAEDRCVADRHDAVIALAGDTGNALSAALAWDKDYTHLIGVGSSLPGVGQRVRITGSTSVDATQLLTISANGCIFRDFQLYNGTDADADSGAGIVSGSRNEFTRVFFAGMGHATPAARAGSYSLKVTGAENLFNDCAIGLDTIIRAAANAELWLSTGNLRNTFRHCAVRSYSDTAGKFAVKIDDLPNTWVEFEDCLFYNMSTNWSQALTDAFSVSENVTHNILLRGNNLFVGFTGIASTVTHVYSAAPAPNAGFGIGLNPTA